MTIYLDVVILENLIMNYIILYATSIVLKIKPKKARMIISSIIGAIYSILAYISILKIYSNIVMKFILSIIIIYIAYNPQNIKKLCKDILMFYLASFVFGGCAFALIYLIKPQDILMKNGLFLGIYPLKTVILSAIVSFIIITVTFKIIKVKKSPKDMLCKIEIKMEGKNIQTKAMIDTGNLLKEPITNTPVVIVEHNLLDEVIPKEILNNLENILGGDFTHITNEIKMKYLSKLKVIPFSSLGKENGMLLGIKPEYINVVNNDEVIRKKNVVIGIYNKSLTKKGEYRALLGIDLLEKDIKTEKSLIK